MADPIQVRDRMTRTTLRLGVLRRRRCGVKEGLGPSRIRHMLIERLTRQEA